MQCRRKLYQAEKHYVEDLMKNYNFWTTKTPIDGILDSTPPAQALQ